MDVGHADEEAVSASAHAPSGNLSIEVWAGDRAALRPMFELAEDSAALLDTCLDDRAGARGPPPARRSPGPERRRSPVKNMAVVPAFRGRGIGRALLAKAVRCSAASGRNRMLVAAAAADVGNLRFYQREGFRMF